MAQLICFSPGFVPGDGQFYLLTDAREVPFEEDRSIPEISPFSREGSGVYGRMYYAQAKVAGNLVVYEGILAPVPGGFDGRLFNSNVVSAGRGNDWGNVVVPEGYDIYNQPEPCPALTASPRRAERKAEPANAEPADAGRRRPVQEEDQQALLRKLIREHKQSRR